MTEINEVSANYSIHGFMTEALKLSGAELLVFALLYSFSRSGTFSGSRRYLAEATATTLRTVDRALASLLERGYVVRVEGDGTERNPIYRTSEEAISEAVQKNRKRKSRTKGCQKDTCQNDTPPVSKCQSESDKIAPNNQEIIKNINKLSSSSSSRTRVFDVSPKYEIRSYGKDGLVSMTQEQYDYICSLVGREIAYDYIRKLEMYMSEPTDFPIRSHFKTICKFIEEDCSIPKK